MAHPQQGQGARVVVAKVVEVAVAELAAAVEWEETWEASEVSEASEAGVRISPTISTSRCSSAIF